MWPPLKKPRPALLLAKILLKIAAELGQKEKDITFTGMLKEGFLDEKIGEAAFSAERR